MTREGKRTCSNSEDIFAIRQVLEGDKVKKTQALGKNGAVDKFKIAGRLWRMRKESG